MGGWGLLFVAGVVAVAVTAAVSVYIYYGRLYMRARVVKAEVHFGQMFRMTAGGVSAFRVVTAYLDAKQAGYDVPLERFETFARSGGNPFDVSRRLQRARRENEPLEVEDAFETASCDRVNDARAEGAA